MDDNEKNLQVWIDAIQEEVATTNNVRLESIEKALLHITEEKDRGLFGMCQYYLAYYYVKNEEIEEALNHLNESIRCMMGTAQEKEISRCYNMLGIFAHAQNNMMLAIEQYDKALLYAKKHEDHYMHYIVLSNTADVYYRVGLYQRAFESYREAFEAYKKSGFANTSSNYNYFSGLANYGFCLAMTGHMDEAEEVSNELDDLRIHTEHDEFPNLSFYTFFSLLCYKLCKDDLARSCLNVAISTAQNVQSITEDFDNIMNLFDLLIQLKEYGILGELVEKIGERAEAEKNYGLQLQLLSYQMRYCTDSMSEEEYLEKANTFFAIKEVFDKEDSNQTLNLMEMAYRLKKIEDEQVILETENERLSYQADHDELSGLYNKGCMNRYAEEAFDYAMKQQETLGVLFVDIDFFKEMNDCYGHNKGDECIEAVAKCIKESMPDDFWARYGGDEFVVILKGKTREYIMEKARQIRQAVIALKIPNEMSTADENLTVTIGAVNGVPKDRNKIWDFLQAADMTLYAQKLDQKGLIRYNGLNTGV